MRIFSQKMDPDGMAYLNDLLTWAPLVPQQIPALRSNRTANSRRAQGRSFTCCHGWHQSDPCILDHGPTSFQGACKSGPVGDYGGLLGE